MGQSAPKINVKSDQTNHEGRYPNNLLIMGNYLGTLATSHFKDWHRVDIHASSSDNDLSLIGMMKRVMNSSFVNGDKSTAPSNELRMDCVSNISTLSEFPLLKNPIIMIANSGNCQLFVDSEYNMTIYKITNYETHDFRMKTFNMLDREEIKARALERKNVIMIGSSRANLDFVFNDMTIVSYNHEQNTTEIIDFFKEHQLQVIEITHSCLGDTICILTKNMEGEYELLEEKDGLINRANLGDMNIGQLENVRLLSASALVTNDNKVYTRGMMHIGGFKYMVTPFEKESQVVQIESGFDHSVVLTQDGNAYAFGFNQYDQCGIAPNGTNIVRQFTKIELPDGYQSKILQIGAGATYTALLTETHILIVGRFTARKSVDHMPRMVPSKDETLWLVTRNTFGINSIHCAGWHLAAIEMVECRQVNPLFGKLLKNHCWLLSDVEFVFQA